jgi:hypothetical protein
MHLCMHNIQLASIYTEVCNVDALCLPGASQPTHLGCLLMSISRTGAPLSILQRTRWGVHIYTNIYRDHHMYICTVILYMNNTYNVNPSDVSLYITTLYTFQVQMFVGQSKGSTDYMIDCDPGLQGEVSLGFRALRVKVLGDVFTENGVAGGLYFYCL